jgi:hypothetical protein
MLRETGDVPQQYIAKVKVQTYCVIWHLFLGFVIGEYDLWLVIVVIIVSVLVDCGCGCDCDCDC